MTKKANATPATIGTEDTAKTTAALATNGTGDVTNTITALLTRGVGMIFKALANTSEGTGINGTTDTGNKEKEAVRLRRPLRLHQRPQATAHPPLRFPRQST